MYNLHLAQLGMTASGAVPTEAMLPQMSDDSRWGASFCNRSGSVRALSADTRVLSPSFSTHVHRSPFPPRREPAAPPAPPALSARPTDGAGPGAAVQG